MWNAAGEMCLRSLRAFRLLHLSMRNAYVSRKKLWDHFKLTMLFNFTEKIKLNGNFENLVDFQLETISSSKIAPLCEKCASSLTLPNTVVHILQTLEHFHSWNPVFYGTNLYQISFFTFQVSAVIPKWSTPQRNDRVFAGRLIYKDQIMVRVLNYFI